MRRFLSILVIAASSVAASAPQAIGSSDPNFHRVAWREASANWLNVDATGCIETRPFVFALDGGGASEESIFVFLLRVSDVCADAQLASFSAEGRLAAGELTVAGSLTSATLSKTFTAVDSVSGESREFAVSATWASTSDLDPSTSSAHGHQLCNGSLDIQNITQRFREAQATGSIFTGDSTTALDSGFGFLAAGTNTTVGLQLPNGVCHP